MEEFHLNDVTFALKATTNLHSKKGVESKWFAQNINGLSSNDLSAKFQTLQVNNVNEALLFNCASNRSCKFDVSIVHDLYINQNNYWLKNILFKT